MASVEEKMPASGAKKDLATGPVFIGFGTKQIICNSGCVTQMKTAESKSSFSTVQLPGTSGCELVQTASNYKQQYLLQPQTKIPEARNTCISIAQLAAYSGHKVQQTVGNNRESTAPQSRLVVTEAKSLTLPPTSSLQLSGPSNSVDLKVLMSKISSAANTVPINSSSVAVHVVPDNISHFELIPVNTTLLLGASRPSNAASGVTMNERFRQLNVIANSKTLSQNSSLLVNISEQGMVSSNQVTGQQSSRREVNVDVEDEDESHTSEEVGSDDALAAENSNALDAVAEDSMETKKTAARRKLNAVLQSAVENQPVIKASKLLSVSKTLEPKLSNLMSDRIMLKPANVSRKSQGQAFAISERPNGMKVRIENAKIVKVAECENSSIRIPSSAMRNIGVDVAQLRCADDIYRKGESPHLIIPPLMEDKEMKEVTVEMNKDPFLLKGSVCTSSTSSGQTYVFEPLSVSADTLVPVTGTSGLRERQNLKEIELMCKQQEQQQDVQDKEPSSSKEPASTSPSAMMQRCFLCPYYHTKATKIAKHWIQVHLTQRPYVCPYCERNYTTSYEAQQHVHRMHPGEKMRIAIKNSAHFASSLAYELVHTDAVLEPNVEGEADEAEQQHYIHTNVLTFSCKKCDFRCTSALDLKAHLRSVHVRYKPHFCMYCTDQKQSFSCDFDLKQHIRRVHPERLPPGGRTFPESVVPALTAGIDWASTYEAIPISSKVIFQCRSCTFRSLSPDSACKHVLTTHEWPKEVKCPSCMQLFQLSSADRQNGSASCSHCQARMSFGPNSGSVARLPEKGVPVFVCTPCEYKTMGKGSMNRHLKYNHTKCRPYACAYCNYSAVERPKIKSHIVHVHPDMEIDIRERTESNDAYRAVLSDLFKTIVKLEYTTDIPVSDMVAMDKERRGKRAAEDESDSDSSSNNLLQKRQRLSLVPNDSLSFATNRSTKVSAQAQERERKVTEGPHFLCMICGYKCVDRSCMSRHIKYMHLPTRPHSCPYCMYSNVEKTKVRLHVKANHPSLQRCVKTDKRILEQLSYEAKQYYIRVDAKGEVMKDGNSATALARYTTTFKSNEIAERDTPVLSSELILTELDPQTDILDVQTDQGAATIVTKAGVFQVGIKEEPLDDVEIKHEPGLTPPGLSPAPAELPTSSTSALDHNYVIDLPSSLPSMSLLESNVTIKTEPEDTGYEMSTVNSLPLLPLETGFSSNNFLSSGSSLEVTDEDDDDDDEGDDDDDDEEEEEDFADVPFGASAFNPDGIESLDEDLEFDEDDDDDDDDLIDLKDIRLDGSEHPFVEVSMSKAEQMEEVVEYDRLRMLSVVRMDEDVRNDPKIWMPTIVQVEDMLSRIHKDKPLLDL